MACIDFMFFKIYFLTLIYLLHFFFGEVPHLIILRGTVRCILAPEMRTLLQPVVCYNLMSIFFLVGHEIIVYFIISVFCGGHSA